MKRKSEFLNLISLSDLKELTNFEFVRNNNPTRLGHL